MDLPSFQLRKSYQITMTRPCHWRTQRWPGYAVAYPKRPTPAHSRACNRPAPSQPQQAEARRRSGKEKKKERRRLRLPHAITRRLRDRPSAHGSPPLGVAQHHSRAGRRRAGRRLAVPVASHPRGPEAQRPVSCWPATGAGQCRPATILAARK